MPLALCLHPPRAASPATPTRLRAAPSGYRFTICTAYRHFFDCCTPICGHGGISAGAAQHAACQRTVQPPQHTGWPCVRESAAIYPSSKQVRALLGLCVPAQPAIASPHAFLLALTRACMAAFLPPRLSQSQLQRLSPVSAVDQSGVKPRPRPWPWPDSL